MDFKKSCLPALLLFVFVFLNGCNEEVKKNRKPILTLIAKQLDTLQFGVEQKWGNESFAPRTFENDTLKLVSVYDWCSGFYPGTLWYMYNLTKNEKWKRLAERYTERLDTVQYFNRTHDLGFMIECSYGTALKFNNAKRYEDVIIGAAKTLVKRFNPNVGAIKSWDWGPQWDFPVIIDNMVNLELLFHATRITGDSTYYNVAVSHADITLKNHFREDNSSFHVVDYDSKTGGVIQKNTFQGLNDSSAWARGQAWALYGYTICFKETKKIKYLEQAIEVASFIKNHPNLPKDNIPNWDFDVENVPQTPRDASAAAIIASALYELSFFVDKTAADQYVMWANDIISVLSSPKYFAELGENGGFLLKHSTGYFPGNREIDVPLSYADYYFIEALTKQSALTKK